jgi:hypothetical protein
MNYFLLLVVGLQLVWLFWPYCDKDRPGLRCKKLKWHRGECKNGYELSPEE